MRASDLPLHYNAVDILERNLPGRADKIALFSTERTCTFGEVAGEANRVGNALRGLGIGMGDVVGILAPDSAEWVTSFFGITKIGAIALGSATGCSSTGRTIERTGRTPIFVRVSMPEQVDSSGSSPTIRSLQIVPLGNIRAA